MPDTQPHGTPTAQSVHPTEPFTVVAMVRPRDGALERIFGLLRRRAPALRALNVSAGAGSKATRVTLTFTATRAAAEQVTEQLRKLLDVESAACFTAAQASDALVVREFALIRMRGDPKHRREIMDVARLFAARIVDVRDGGITLEASGSSNVIENILAMLHPLGVVEVARSGGLTMRCDAATPATTTDAERSDFT